MGAGMNKPAAAAFDSLSIAHRDGGWETRFHSLIAEELAKPFSWVNGSCIDLMAASVLACRGPKHPSILAIPEYTTDEQAQAELKKRGGLEKLLSKYFPDVPVLHAMQGDLVLLKSPAEASVMAGGVILDGVIVGKREGIKSAYRLPLSLAYKVYRV